MPNITICNLKGLRKWMIDDRDLKERLVVLKRVQVAIIE